MRFHTRHNEFGLLYVEKNDFQCDACRSHCRVSRAQAELLRTTCAVLIRRIVVPSGPHWDRLSGPTKASLRAGLLSAIGKETRPAVARKVRSR